MEKFEAMIASGPVIIENGKVLLNRHGKTLEAQKIWKFVGGSVDAKDYQDAKDILEEACRREVREEMGLEIEIITPLKPILVERPDQPGSFVVLIHYLAKRIGEIAAGDDIIDWNWFDIEKLPADCAPNIRPVIEDYKKLVANKYRISSTAVHEL